MKNVNRYTRAGKNGKQIRCPKCSSTWTVFHFSWYSLTCQTCQGDINKSDWMTVEKVSTKCPI